MTMTELSNFVSQNYFWILIIGIVLIMSLIGYIADKKNLVRLEKRPNKAKMTEEEAKAVLESVKDKPIADTVYENSETVKNKTIENIEEMKDAPDSDIPAELFAPMTEEVQTINGMEVVDFGDFDMLEEEQTYEEVASETNDVPAELYAPLESTASEEEVVEEDNSSIDADLPDLNTVGEETAEEDDVWKF